ncbi:hypothetical protein Tco_0621414, partial [Tanacetum coccineum]
MGGGNTGPIPKGIGSSDNDYEEHPVFDDDQFEEELEMLDDAFVLIGKEVA